MRRVIRMSADAHDIFGGCGRVLAETRGTAVLDEVWVMC